MNTQAQHSSISESESGQAALLVALVLFFAFLGFAALAIDGAMTYSVRRDLQNVADSATLAACRVIASNDTSLNSNIRTAAVIAAENTIAAHLGSYAEFAGSNPPASNIGAGTSLLKGIEVSTSVTDTRVALQRSVPTVLTQFLGRGDSIMVAFAHCDARAGGGLMPIAVRRWDGVSGAQTDFVARQGVPTYTNDSIMVMWSPARYPNPDYSLNSYAVPVPCGNPGAPTCPGAVDYTAHDSAVPGVPDANSGPVVAILGQGALPNTGVNSYNNFVMPDIRDVASGSPEYYNGATGNPNTDKNISQQYIYRGYPGPYLIPGEEMAILDGASASFEAHSVIGAGYRVGDALTVMVYDGNVWDTPSFSVNLTPQAGNGILTNSRPTDPTTNAVAYNVRIASAGSANWSTPLNFNLNFKLSEATAASPGSCGPGIQMGIKVGTNPMTTLSSTLSIYSYTANNVIQASGWTGTLYVWTTDPTTTVPSCVSGLNLIAVDSQGLDKGTSSQFGFGSPTPLPANYYTLRSGTAPSSGAGIITIQQGQSVKPTLNLITHGFGSVNCNANVSASVWSANGTAQQTWTSFFPAADQTTSIVIKNNTDKNPPNNYSLDALLNPPAPISAPLGNYILRFTVVPSSGSCTGLTTRTIEVPLSVEPPPGGTSIPTKFVVFQGYAVFRISGFTPNPSNPNTVWGYAISPLYQSLSQITYGLEARLVPWN